MHKLANPEQGERIIMPNVPLTYRGRGNPDDYPWSSDKTRPYLFDMPGYERDIPDEYPQKSLKELGPWN